MNKDQKPSEEQLNQQSTPVDTDVETNGETNNTIVQALSEDERERLSVIQELLAARDQVDYASHQKAAAKKLGITVRSVRRLIQKCRNQGIAGVVRQSRSDCGSSRRACRLAEVYSQNLL